MAACPLCSEPVNQSTVALDSALVMVEERENTIVRLENQGLINFIVGLVIGFGLFLAVNHFTQQKGSLHEPVRQTSTPRTDPGK